ncbi:PAS-domain containing protein [Ramlibacter sp.]|uniref:PAS-domain containing protein n=1 Tax=Ramlibacter sp. TaxID=1917967 RepID=UPI0017E4EB67|nr:PAS-domain containing protein [Ramlibacter sp.]MBA2675812.1 PAS-domain containing protein [Ramlibacter sp.]
MVHTDTRAGSPAASAPEAAGGLTDLVNRLTQELASMQRALAAAQQKLGSTSRSLESRTQELTEARAALALLLATLDSTTDGILALGYFGRAMHYNSRFIEMWRIPADMLASLNDSALLTLQLAQVKHPQRFLAEAEARKARPDEEHFGTVEMTDGRVLECHVAPQRVRGKRVGCVTSFHDVTEHERLERLVSVLEAELPSQVAEAKASMF